MPEIIFDFAEINKNLRGDKWWMPDKQDEADKPNPVEQCTPNPTVDVPWDRPTLAPPNPPGQPPVGRGIVPLPPYKPWPDVPVHKDDPAVASIYRLILSLDNRIAEETKHLNQRVEYFRHAVLRSNRRELEMRIENVTAGYQAATAPLRRQRDALLMQLSQLLASPRMLIEPPRAVEPPEDYECEVFEPAIISYRDRDAE